MRTFLCLATVSLLSGLLTSTPAAFAQDGVGRAAARVLAQEGAALFEKDDFAGALAKFKQAYEQFPSPKLFLNIGQALRGLGRNVEALVAFERFLAETPDASAEYREQATAQVADLNDRLARVAVACNRTGASVAIDGEKKGNIPLAKPVVVEPGPHQLTATWQGKSASIGFATVAGQETSQTVTFEDTPPPPVPVVAVAPKPEPPLVVPSPVVPVPTSPPSPQPLGPRPSAPLPPPVADGSASPPVASVQPVPAAETAGHGMRVAGIACGAVGLAAIATGVYYYTRATSLSDRVSNSDSPSPTDHKAGKDAHTMQWVFYSAGAAALATGSALYYLGWRASVPVQTTFAPMVRPGLAGLWATGVF